MIHRGKARWWPLLALQGCLTCACDTGSDFAELRVSEQKLKTKLADEQRERVQAEALRQQEKTAADKRRRHEAAVKKLAALKPWDRAAQLATCARDETKCPEKQSLDIFLEAAASDVERQNLTAVWKLNQRPKESQALQDPQAHAVMCCDGTLSPSCVCGGPMRDCCGRHRGVCGCK